MKKALRLQANNEDETTFVYSLDDKKSIEQLEWEGNDEFSLNGEMYDMIEKKIENNKLIIRCISDKKETALIKKYEKINNENNSKSKSALLLKLVSSSYLATVNAELLIKYKPVPSIIYFQCEIVSSRPLDVLTPPPQVV
jgi:hypothetical protein